MSNALVTIFCTELLLSFILYSGPATAKDVAHVSRRYHAPTCKTIGHRIVIRPKTKVNIVCGD